MLARKVMTLMTVVAAGLTSLGIVLAEDPKPNQPPTTAKMVAPQPLPVQFAPQPPSSPPIQPPLAPTATDAANKPSETLQKQLKQIEQTLKPGELQVVIQGLCLQVTGGFVEESGLTVDNPKMFDLSPCFVTTLNPREAKMLTAMIRGLKAQERLDILSRPQLTIPENQTGYFQVGQTFDVAALTEATKDNGKTVPAPKTPKVSYSVGPCVTLKVTPKIDKDSGNILLRVDAQTTSIGGNVIVNSAAPAAKGQNAPTTSTVPSMNVETIQTTVMLPDGGTAVIGNVTKSALDKAKKTEMLWVLTAHLVRGK